MSETSTFEFGWEGQLFRGEPGEAPGIEVLDVIDVDWADEMAEHPVPRRRSGGFNVKATGLRDISFTVTIPHQPTNADWLAFANAYIDRAPISVKVLDAGDENGQNQTGILGDFLVSSFSVPQKYGEVTVNTVKFVPTDRYGRVPTDL